MLANRDKNQVSHSPVINCNELATNNGETRDYTVEQTHDNRGKPTRGALSVNSLVTPCVGKKTNKADAFVTAYGRSSAT